MKIFITVIVVLAALLFLVWLGLQIKPKSFSPHPQAAPELETIPLPDSLPAPVERFYQTVYGSSIPVIDTAARAGP
jgi:hypothetical protein